MLSERYVFRGSSCAVLANALCGMIGVVNTLAFWPLIPALSAVPMGGVGGWRSWIAEPFEAPNMTQLVFVVTNMLLALLYVLLSCCCLLILGLRAAARASACSPSARS